MGTVTISGMLAAEAGALSGGWTEESLLDLAGERLGLAIGRFFPVPGIAVGYLGKGHNAGDTLVALGVLRDRFGWRIGARNAFPMEEWAPLTLRKWRQLGLDHTLSAPPSWRDEKGTLLLLDGLLGTGSKGSLKQELRILAEEMEWLRGHAGARVAAVDVPSGIEADSGKFPPGTVTADATFMIANPKRGLLLSHAANATGALALVPLEPLTSEETGEIELICPQLMDTAKRSRPFDFHKGMAGRVNIVAGSESYTGAAILAATGALRGGGGLITLHAPRPAVSAIASRCPPEIIVRGYSSFSDLRETRTDAWVVGCGIGHLDAAPGAELLDFIAGSTVPMVIDADALNLISSHDAIHRLTDLHLVTPHPGEFRRLAPDLAEMPRESAARAFVERTSATLLLKGCRTLVTRKGQPLWSNSTGSPGMATGGQGDLLAGVIGARLALGDSALDAASLSAWLCGRAAEIAIADTGSACESEESLTPSCVANRLGAAYRDWRASLR